MHRDRHIEANPHPMTTPKRNPTIGKIHCNAAFIRIHAGEATRGKLAYTMAANVIPLSPIVVSKQTGKSFTLSWAEIIDLAVAAGIDEPERKKK